MNIFSWIPRILIALLHTLTHTYTQRKDESIVSPVARRYTRVINGRERLVVCLSENLPLRIVYRISSMSTIAQ